MSEPFERRPEHFLGGFRHDVFVSYAHVDNEPDRPDLDGKQGTLGWVDRFMQRFSRLLWRSVAKDVNIWFDRYDLYDGHRFDAEIREVVGGSAVFLTLISPGYLTAPYCRKELDWFVSAVRSTGRSLDFENQSRVRPVLLYKIPSTEWPDALKGVTGSGFYAEGIRGSTIPWDPVHDDAEFTRAIVRLAGEVGSLLRAMKASEAPAVLPETRAFKVYLAATSDTSARQKRRLATALGDVPGIDVVGVTKPIPPPLERGPHAVSLRAVLDQVDMAVHLLDGLPGMQIGGVPDGFFPEEQCRIALRHPCSQLIVLSESLDLETIEENGYREFVAALERGTLESEKQSSRALRVARERSDDKIIEMILAARNQRDKSRPDAARPSSVFIDLETRDLPLVDDFRTFLSQQNVEAVTISSSEQTPAESTSDFEDTLTRSAALFIIYGAVGRDWVKSRLEQALRLILRHDLPLKPVVYAAPPAKSPAQLSFSFCHVVDGTAGFNAHAVAYQLGRGALA